MSHRVSQVCVFVVMAAATLAFGAGSAIAQTGTDILRYNFDGPAKFNPQGQQIFTDVTGRGHVGAVKVANNGGVLVVQSAVGQGKAVRFPTPCEGTGCPKAIVEAADAPDLNPGNTIFSYGAWIFLDQSELTTGSNVVQKGFFNDPGGQWKLQVDNLNGIPSCVVQGNLNGQHVTTIVVPTTGAMSITGSWHQVSCKKRDTFVSILIDGLEVGRQTVTVGTVSNTAAVRIGGKSTADANDQFHGVIDNVFFRLGQ